MNEILRAASLDEAPKADDPQPAVVVGAGPTGFHVARLLARGGANVVLLGGESETPYDRVKLTPLLAGEVQLGQISQRPESLGRRGRLYTGAQVIGIDRDAQTVETASGRVFPYAKLVLCLGSEPFVPPVPGFDAENVFTFRDTADVSALKARSFAARNVVVIGGGLLGLEAARGMAVLGARVTVIEHETRLMPRQLDDTASDRLIHHLEGLGVKSVLGVRVDEIEAPYGRAAHVRLSDAERLVADTVVICTGVRPNVDLARDAGLITRRGIIVDPNMRSSDENIWAAGECVEHDGIVEGLVGPCLEQAEAAAASMLGREDSYASRAVATRLKVAGADIFSMGQIESLEDQPGIKTLTWEDGDAYRRLFIGRGGTLLAAISVGPWRALNAVQQMITDGARLSWRSRYRFTRTGRIQSEAADNPAMWGPNVLVCNCTGVTRGQIGSAVARGASTLDQVRAETRASTVCGSCAPLIEEILDAGGAPKPVRMFQTLTALSVAGLALAIVTLLMPRIPFAESFSARGLVEWFFLDNIAKQWTGYTLLGVTVLAALLGLRKRIRLFDRLGSYDWWRVVHLGLGGLSAVVLFAHTGFRLGDNLSLALMLVYLGTLIAGAISGLATGRDHDLRAAGLGSATKPPRILPIWVHILLLWPLPVLLAVHILVVYAY